MADFPFIMGGPLKPMNLGVLADAMSACEGTKSVHLDVGGYAGGLHSHRGNPEQLAIDPIGYAVTTAEFLRRLTAAIGETFESQKGYEYRMTTSTPLWVAPYGEISGARVVRVVERAHDVVIRTVDLSDEW